VLVPFMGARVISVNVQDFCNLLEGGLVSFSTLSDGAVAALQNMPFGSFVCSYEFSPSDVLGSSAQMEVDHQQGAQHIFYAACWRGVGPTINVMCNKIGIFLCMCIVSLLLCLIINYFYLSLSVIFSH
jgi:hypothetical protein